MKKIIILILVLNSFMANSQITANTNIGGAITSGNMAITHILDVNYVFTRNPNYLSGFMFGGTLATDFGHGTSYGITTGYMGYQLSLYTGISKFISFVENGQKEKLYPIFGTTFRWEDTPAIADLRFQHNSVMLTFGVRFPFKHFR